MKENFANFDPSRKIFPILQVQARAHFLPRDNPLTSPTTVDEEQVEETSKEAENDEGSNSTDKVWQKKQAKRDSEGRAINKNGQPRKKRTTKRKEELIEGNES